MKTYYLHPSPTRGEFNRGWGGIRGSVEVHLRLLPKYGWQEVHTENEADIVVGYLSTKSKRLDVFHLRGLYPTGEIEMVAGFWQSNATIIENIRRAKHVVCVSEWVADILRRDMHMNPHVVPGHGVDLDYWNKVEPYQRPDQVSYALWNKSRRHGVCDPKPVVTLARAFPNQQFITTFLPPEYDGTKLSNVTVTGVMDYDQMWPIVKGSSIYIATTKETFGRGVLEAMASGAVVIGYDWGAVPDIVGDCAILVPPENETALMAAFAEALERKEELVEKAHVHLAEHFTWDSVVAQTAAIYDLALESQKSTTPKVSVVIPCFNYEQYVTLAITSVLSQTYTDWELIVVDDGSSDSSVEIIKATIAEEPRAKLIQQENMGVAHARNNGIREAKGEYIVCLDADDAIDLEFLATLVSALDVDPKLGIAYTALKFMYEDNGVNRRASMWPKQYNPHRGLDGNQIPTCCMFRRSWWERVGGYRQRFAPYGAGQEDADFWVRILANGGSASRVTDEGLFFYRRHPKQTTRVHKDYWAKNRYPAWYPFYTDYQHPIASQLGVPPNGSWPVRNYDCPEVGVVIPVGPSHTHLITDALDSLEAQSFRNWECVVINDSGRELDLTPWPYVKVLETSGEKGPGYARNRGTEILKAPLVVYLDADDWFQTDALKRFVAVQREYGGWVYSDQYLLRPDGSTVLHEQPDWNPRHFRFQAAPLITSCIPVEAWRDVGGFDEDPTLLREDLDFLLKLMHRGHCGIRIPVPLFTYRHSTSKRRHGWHGDEDRTWQRQRIHDRYPLEEILMSCRGCGSRRIRRGRRGAAVPAPTSVEQKVEQGWVALEYTGSNQNTLTFRGNDSRRYRAGGDSYHRFIQVHPDDVERMLRFPYFRKTTNPTPKNVLEAEAQPRPAPVVAKPASVPSLNVTEMKVTDVLDLDLVPSQWQEVLAQEETQDRPRKTIVKYAKRRIRVAQASA